MATTLGLINVKANKTWDIAYSKGLPRHPNSHTAGWRITIPQKPGELHYVWKRVAKPIGPGELLIEGKIIASSDAAFNFKLEKENTGTHPASARAIIQLRGDDMVKASGRLWSNPAHILLQDGTFSIRVPLKQSQWSNVNGKRSGLKAAMARPQRVGLTFGGGNFFGHGVNMSKGSARFILTRFKFIRE